MNLRWPGIDRLVFPDSGGYRLHRKPAHKIKLRMNFVPELQKSVDHL